MSEILAFIIMILLFIIGIIYCNKKNLTLLKNIIKGLLVFFIFFFSSIFSKILLLILNMKYKESMDIYLNTFSNVCLLIILIFMYKSELIKEFKNFKKNYSDDLDVGFKYWFFGLLIMMISNILITRFITNGAATNEKAVQEMIASLPILMIINAGIIAPMIEEITFRKCFKNVFSNKWLFVIISALIFGSLHVIPGIMQGSSINELFYIIPYSALGASFALMYYDTDTIFTSYSMHFLHNTILVIFSILR